MNQTVVLLWALNVLLDTAGQLAFKAAASDDRAGDGMARWRYMLAHPWIWLGGACYVFEFPVWIAFLSLLPLGRGILLGSINIVAIMLAGRLLFGERLSRMRVAGMLLVSLGVVLVGASG
ncbi:MAG: hypothetical protein WB784_07855 [Rhodanobacteraceae bacterium]